MQSTETLKKRSRRNLSKVHGLTQVGYDVTQDTFTGNELFGSTSFETRNVSNKITSCKGSDTRICMNSSKVRENRRNVEKAVPRNSGKIYSRITRDPSFHDELNREDTEQENEDSENPEEECIEGKQFTELGPFNKRKYVEHSIKDRECFLDNDTMKRLRQLIWLGIFTGSFPWKWNSKTNRIEKWSVYFEKLWWVQWLVVTIQTCALTVFQLYAFLEAVSNAKTYRTAFQSSFSLLWYSYAVILNINLYYYKEAIRSYINTLMRFNKEYVSKYLIHLNDYEDGGRWIINCAVITKTIQIFVSASLFCVMPYQPWYLFSYIYPKPWYWLIVFAYQEFMQMGNSSAPSINSVFSVSTPKKIINCYK